MKTLNVAVLNTIEESVFAVAGHELEISSFVGGNIVKISAFINNNGYVSTGSGAGLHWLFKKSPVTSEFVEHANKAVQEAFIGWKPEINQIQVSI